MKHDHFVNVAIVHTDPETGEQTLRGKIRRRKAYNVPKRFEISHPTNCRQKVWVIGDTESEAVYKEQGWFPD